MKPGMKMLAIEHVRKSGRDYDMEDRFYNGRGREHYDSGRYAPMRTDTNIEIEGRFRDDHSGERFEERRGAPMRYEMMPLENRRYRRDSRGRFRSEMDEGEMRMGDDMESRRRRDSRGRFRSEWDDGMENNWREDSREMEANYPGRPFPVYERGDRMNQIGFYTGGDEIRTDYGMNIGGHTGSEMEHRTNQKMNGGAHSYEAMPMTKEMAEEWTAGMRNEDGTKGPHWTIEQAKQVMAQKGIDCGSPETFWAILCAMYSDYCAVLKKYGMNKMDVYVDLACAWLNDKDAVGGGGAKKAGAYYEHVVKK